MSTHAIPPFAALRAFEATFRLGGVRKAAAGLGVSHAIVSRHIASLEDWLGVALVSRVGNRLELTEAGSGYHAKISAAFAEMAFATRELRQEDGPQSLRISCLLGFSIQWLARRLMEFEELHPLYKTELRPTNTPANLHAHEADVNIVFHRDNDGPFVVDRWVKAHELARAELVMVAAPSLAATLPAIAAPTELLDLPLLHGGSHQEEWQGWLVSNGVKAPEQLPGTLCWNVNMAIEAAKLGRGVLLATRFVVSHELATGDLVELTVPGTHAVAMGSYMFVAREDRWSASPIAALRKFVSHRMREG